MNLGKPRSSDPDEQKDDVYAFFQCCYHLKDWLKEDSEFQSPKKVEVYVAQNKFLIICADICNASKHAYLKNPHKDDNKNTANIALEPKRVIYAKVFNGGEAGSVSIKMEITYNDDTLDAFDVATNAVNVWKSFIADPT